MRTALRLDAGRPVSTSRSIGPTVARSDVESGAARPASDSALSSAALRRTGSADFSSASQTVMHALSRQAARISVPRRFAGQACFEQTASSTHRVSEPGTRRRHLCSVALGGLARASRQLSENVFGQTFQNANETATKELEMSRTGFCRPQSTPRSMGGPRGGWVCNRAPLELGRSQVVFVRRPTSRGSKSLLPRGPRLEVVALGGPTPCVHW